MNDEYVASKEKLLADFKVVIADTEELLKLTAGGAEGKFEDVRGRLGDRIEQAKDHIAEAEMALKDHTRKMARVADHYVHENPWQSVGVAAGVAFVFGILLGRR